MAELLGTCLDIVEEGLEVDKSTTEMAVVR